MQNNRKAWENITPKDLLSPAGRRYTLSKEPDHVSVPLLLTGISIVLYILLFNDFEHYSMTLWFLLLPVFAGVINGLAYFLRWAVRKLIRRKNGSDHDCMPQDDQ